MHTLLSHLKQSFRRLFGAPLFTFVTLLTLAAGVGGNTIVFSVLESVLLKPLPYPHPEELIGVWHTAPGVNEATLAMAPSNYFIYREQNRSFEDIGMYGADSVSVTGLAEPEQVDALRVTDGTLPLLGIPPVLGRWFTKQDDSPGSPDTVILTYGYWRKKFAGSSSVLGQSLLVDGQPHQIIGVLPQRFHFLDWQDPALLLPFQFNRNKLVLGNFAYNSLARLKPGVTLQQASADIARMVPLVYRSFRAPDGFSMKIFDDARIGPNLHTLKFDVVGDVGSTLWVLMGSLGLVLLIACANVANLLLVRVEGRRQELAVRAALGATPYRIAGALFLESFLLGLLGSILGLALAFAALRVLMLIAPAGIPRIKNIGIDAPVLLFTFAVSIFASILFACIPIFKYAGVRLSTGIREGGRANSQSREQHRLRGVLVVVQIALALVLLICSGLMIRTFRALTHVNPGFAYPVSLQTLRIAVPETLVKDDRVLRMYQDMLDKISAIPGVSSAGLENGLPMDGSFGNNILFAQDRVYAAGQLPPLRRFRFVTPGFFSTLATPFLAGRDMTWTEVEKRIPVVVISENFAREYWDTPANAIGKRLRVSTIDDWREIVGVVANVCDDGVSKPPSSTAYWPIILDRFQADPGTTVHRNVSFAIRSPRAGSEAFLNEVRGAIWSVNPNLPVSNVHTLDYFYTRSMARTSFTLIMLAVAGSMALLLGVVGIYGVIAYAVSQRTREIGIRMALGAQTQTVTSMFVRHGVILTAIGISCGLIASFITMRLMASILFHVKPIDPLTYTAVTLALLATALLASYLPSRRAANVDPVDALRAE